MNFDWHTFMVVAFGHLLCAAIALAGWPMISFAVAMALLALVAASFIANVAALILERYR